MYICLIDGYLSNEYVVGVEQFVEFCKTTVHYANYGEKLRCPCRKCDNRRIIPVPDVKVYLYSRGFVENYYHWVYHGETREMFNAAVQEARQYEGSSSNADVVVEEPNEIQQYS